MELTDKAGASRLATDTLYAPGLKRRPRVSGEALYWIPPAKDVKAGYRPKSLTLPDDASEIEIAALCRKYWAELQGWREPIKAPTRHTISWLIDRYLNDDESPFHDLRQISAQNYLDWCKVIRATVGERRLDPITMGGIQTPRITGDDVRRWHRNWGKPLPVLDDTGKPVLARGGVPAMAASTPSRARHVVVQLRILVKYAVTIGVPGAIEFRQVLRETEFPTTPAREKAPSFEQAMKLVKAALESDNRSIAIATLGQFEFTERRVSIIGAWENGVWRPGWIWQGISPDWIITYWQNKVGAVRRQYDLKSTPLLLDLLKATPEDQRIGPVVVCEATGIPWRKRHYATKFREVARAAGLPDDLWSMDMRAGGATEADTLPGVTIRDLQDAGGWRDPKMALRYTRERQRRAQNVVDMRQVARAKTGEERN